MISKMIEAKTIAEVASKPDRYVRIFSKRLDEIVVVLSDELELEEHKGECVLYRINEMEFLKNLSDKAFRVQHELRKKFDAIPLKKSEQKERRKR